MGISYSVDTEDAAGLAMGRDLRVSHKDLVEICRELRGMDLVGARERLDAVVEEEEAVPMKRHSAGAGHRSELDGWDAGGYPVKAARELDGVLHNAQGNAEEQGFDADDLVVEHVAAHKVGEIRGVMPRAFGRASPANTPLVDVEVVLGLKEGVEHPDEREDEDEEAEETSEPADDGEDDGDDVEAGEGDEAGDDERDETEDAGDEAEDEAGAGEGDEADAEAGDGDETGSEDEDEDDQYVSQPSEPEDDVVDELEEHHDR
ncbi:MAG: 50S ribosomal protein L22 [Halobacteriales archaeon]